MNMIDQIEKINNCIYRLPCGTCLATKELCNHLHRQSPQISKENPQPDPDTPIKDIPDPLKYVNVPFPCINCPNHTVNGGNGNCNCTLGDRYNITC